MRIFQTAIALVVVSVSSALWGGGRSQADELRVFGAGSLAQVMAEMLRRFPSQSDTVAQPEFGPSGLMREKIEAGAAVDVFASADMAHARRLAAGDRQFC